MGWAQVVDGRADGVFKRTVAVAELLADDAGGLEAEPGVRLGVVADEVAGGVDAAHDLRSLRNEAADHEERSASIVLGEEIEESVGRDVVRAVVVGERYFVGVAAGDDGMAEELRAWAESRVG